LSVALNMYTPLFYTLLWSIGISTLSLIGILALGLKRKFFDDGLPYMVGLSAGVLMGGAFLHILPEALELSDDTHEVFILFLSAFVIFFVIEKVLHWHHCHKGLDAKHTIGWMNLIGDAIHNFVDGVLIFSAFAIDTNIGIITAIGVALHEIPQEISDFGVLVYSGFNKIKALIFNLVASLSMILGVIVGYTLDKNAGDLIIKILPLAAGGFVYISATDLMPEIKSERKAVRSFAVFCVFLLGVLTMYWLGLGEKH
jgi:zinc and cadmium transporter